MPQDESQLPADWLIQADEDIRAVEILLAQHGPLGVIAFHIQQAVEKCLKGYLIGQKWPLRRTHDLELLVQEAIALDIAFSSFLQPCRRITEYYIETRYPLGIQTSLKRDDLLADLQTVYALRNLIWGKVHSTEEE
jgi:HEPN domain-containing protein